MSKTEGDGQSEETQNSFLCRGIGYVPAPTGDDTVSDRCTLCREHDCNCWIPLYAQPSGRETIYACTPDGTTTDGTTMCKQGGIYLGTPGPGLCPKQTST